MSVEEMFATLYAMIHYCTSIAGAALIVGLICIIGIFVMLLCLVVIDRKINYMREAMGILPPESPKPSLFGKRKKRSRRQRTDAPKASLVMVVPNPDTVKAMEKIRQETATEEKKDD